jgi:site-specific DNA-adenine methylase
MSASPVASPIKWIGGKHASAHRIVAAFPPPSSYDLYIEPCVGAAHVLMAKPPYSHKEVCNDLDDLLINFWQEIQQNGQAVQEQLAELPYARKLYYDFYHSLYGAKQKGIAPDPALSATEKAVRWLYILRSNMTGYLRASAPGWAYQNAQALKHAAHLITLVQQRIQYVAFDNRDVIETIKRYARMPERVFFYVDPPYMRVEHYYPASREGFDHVALAEALGACRCPVALSYYPHSEVDRLYPASRWRRISWQQHKPSNVSNNHQELDVATELLLCNYPEPAHMLSLWTSNPGGADSQDEEERYA